MRLIWLSSILLISHLGNAQNNLVKIKVEKEKFSIIGTWTANIPDRTGEDYFIFKKDGTCAELKSLLETNSENKEVGSEFSEDERGSWEEKSDSLVLTFNRELEGEYLEPLDLITKITWLNSDSFILKFVDGDDIGWDEHITFTRTTLKIKEPKN